MAVRIHLQPTPKFVETFAHASQPYPSMGPVLLKMAKNIRRDALPIVSYPEHNLLRRQTQ
jgi:hypothetical protein